MIPAAVIEVRREICARCPNPCAAHAAGQIDHADPAAACPVSWSGSWARYGKASRAAKRDRWAKPRRLLAAMVKWSRGGFRIADYLARQRRRAICHACPIYDRSGNAGLGACRHARCGCTGAKRWLATETCPLGKW